MNTFMVLGSYGNLGIDIQRYINESFNNWFLNDKKVLENNRFYFYGKEKVNINNLNSIEHEMYNKFDGIINLSAYTDVDRFEFDKDYFNEGLLVNGYSVLNLIHICNEYNIPLIHISTDYVFSGDFNGKDMHIYSEFDDTEPINRYGKTKLIAEELIKKYCKKYIILRISGLYGITKKTLFLNFINKIDELHYKFCDDWYFTPTSTLEVYYGITKILEHFDLTENENFWNQIYHLSSSKNMSKYEFYELIASKFPDKNIEISSIELNDLKLPARRPIYSGLSNKKFIKTFNAYKLENFKIFFDFMVKNACKL